MPQQKLKAKDPIQERLKQHKRQWNASYKDLAGKIKAFKNGLNGKGDTKFSIPPSDIKNPLPEQMHSLLGQLTSDFSNLISGANAIASEQEQYSKTRKKKQPKRNVSIMAPAEPSVEQNNPLANIASIDNSLVFKKYASSRLTRLWQYFISFFSRKEQNRYRVNMLRITADMFYTILDFENEVLSLNENSAVKSIKKFQSAKYDFESLKNTFDYLSEMINKKQEEISGEAKPAGKSQTQKPKQNEQQQNVVVEEPPAEPDAPSKSNRKDINKIKEGIHILMNTGLVGKHIVPLQILVSTYEKETDPMAKNMYMDRLVDNYEQVVNSIANKIQKKYGPANIRTSQDVIDLIKNNRFNKDAFEKSETLVKNAHNILTRFLKKQLLKAAPFNKTVAHRLEIEEMLKDLKKTIQSLMNSLEQELDLDEVSRCLDLINNLLSSISKPLSIIGIMHKQKFYDNMRKTPNRNSNNEYMMYDDPLTDMVLKRRIRRDLSRDF